MGSDGMGRGKELNGLIDWIDWMFDILAMIC